MDAAERPLRSPCVSVCALDEDGLCVGCQRSAAEITRWGRMDNAERREVLRRCDQRARDKGVLLP
jgi:hypothetical protein